MKIWNENDMENSVLGDYGSTERRWNKYENNKRLEICCDGDWQDVPNHFYSVYYHRYDHRPVFCAAYYRHVIRKFNDTTKSGKKRWCSDAEKLLHVTGSSPIAIASVCYACDMCFFV